MTTNEKISGINQVLKDYFQKNPLSQPVPAKTYAVTEGKKLVGIAGQHAN